MAQIPAPRAAQSQHDVTDGDGIRQFVPFGVAQTGDAATPMAHSPAELEAMVAEAMPLVGYLVTEMITRLPSHVRREDLESAGYEALVRCAKSYDPTIGTSFVQYARIRVRGAMVDELRSADWASRGTRRAERRITGAEDVLTNELGRSPSRAELAAHLGEEGADLVRTRDRVQRAAVLSLNALIGESEVDLVAGLVSDDPGQEERILEGERNHLLHAAVAALPERLRVVITEYFLGEKPMAEIARDLGVSESRISQMRAQALELLREGLGRHLEDEAPAAAPVTASTPDTGVAARRREEYYARVAALASAQGRQDIAPAQPAAYPMSRYGNGARAAHPASALSALA